MIASAPAGTIPASTEFAAPWGARGYVTELDGPVHWIEFGSGQVSGQVSGRDTRQVSGQDSGQDTPRLSGQDTRQDSGLDTRQDALPIVFVHGLGGSHLNWCRIGPQLAAGRRAVAMDLHGFGLTPGTKATATVQANARLLDRFVREITGTPVILVGNSMGGLISILETAAAPDAVAGVVLIDPALPPPRQKPDWQVSGSFLLYALPGLGELFARVLWRRPPELAVRQLIELCFADPSRADPAMTAAEVALAAQRRAASAHDLSAGRASFLAAERSLMRVLGRRTRYREKMAAIGVPVLLIGGDADRLVPVASMRQAAASNPRWECVIFAGVGHTPQLEIPDLVVGTISDWLDRHFTPESG
jgi:pimeloyl-ACP methyl ester carboxylesterase